MGYRDDFYIVGNIIGHTGKVHSDPTVYFQHGDEYGHITQNHQVKENIGREEVSQHAEYRIGNEEVNGIPMCIEREGNEKVHTSRSKFVSTANLSSLQKKVLARSIYNFTSKKKRSTTRFSWESYILTHYGAPMLELFKLGRHDFL